MPGSDQALIRSIELADRSGSRPFRSIYYAGTEGEEQTGLVVWYRLAADSARLVGGKRKRRTASAVRRFDI